MAKRFIDYAFKSYVLKEHNDLLQKAKQSKKLDYAINEYRENGVLMPILERSNDVLTMNELFSECFNNGLEKEYFEALKINDASYKRVQRLRKRIEDMLVSGPCVFLTLTFNDNTLNTTTEKQRRVLVSRYLKQYQTMYVANIDFGKDNEREHYHACICCERVSHDSWDKYGNIDFKRIRNRNIERDKTRLAKYICKLSNHAIKETTRRCSLLYSR